MVFVGRRGGAKLSGKMMRNACGIIIYFYLVDGGSFVSRVLNFFKVLYAAALVVLNEVDQKTDAH